MQHLPGLPVLLRTRFGTLYHALQAATTASPLRLGLRGVSRLLWAGCTAPALMPPDSRETLLSSFHLPLPPLTHSVRGT